MFLLSLYTNPFVLGTTLIVTVGLLTFYFYKITKDREQFFASENIDPEITAIKKERNTRSVALLNKRISNNTHHQSKKHAKTNIYNILAKFSKIW
ncbi:MAG: hypothetical protein H3C31_05135 [Brumimicrobium sp.]|nr:hypothetical protein [Brumimicrobium sp.]